MTEEPGPQPEGGTPGRRTPTARRENALPAPAVGDLTPHEVVGVRHGMFGVHGSGDTSGYGGLVRPVAMPGGDARRRTAAGSTRSPTRCEAG